MEETKKWYESRAVWGGIIVVAVAVLNVFGVSVDETTKGCISEYITDILTALGGLLAIWGRLTSRKPIE